MGAVGAAGMDLEFHHRKAVDIHELGNVEAATRG